MTTEEKGGAGGHVHAGPIRITIEIDRPSVGVGKASGHMRSAVREAMISLREVLDAGIQAVDERDEDASSSTSERIAIE